MTFVSGITPTPDPSSPDDTPADAAGQKSQPEATPASSATLSGRDLVKITAVSLVIAFAVAIGVVLLTNNGSDNDAVSIDEFLSDEESSAPTDAPEAGDLVPNLDLQLFDGTTTTLDQQLDRPMVVNVWASTCAPCLREMPDFEAVYQDLGDQVGFLGLDSGETKDDGAPFADQVGVTYPLAEDPDQAHSIALGLVALPMTLFINDDGTLAHRQLGAMDEAELRKNIDNYLDVAS